MPRATSRARTGRTPIPSLPLRLISEDPAAPPRAETEPDGAAFEALFEHAGAMLAILDTEGRFLTVNPACTRVLGVEPSTLVGRSLLDLARSEAPPQALSLDGEPGENGIPREQLFDLLARHRHADGTWRWLLWSGAVHGDRWYASAKDITDWVKLEDRVGRDPLTRLPNKEVFLDEVTQALARNERTARSLGILFVDIDQLKQINDSIGHQAGDRLIAQVAERLRMAVRANDVVARLGGDEFGILVESLGEELEAVTVAGRALAALDDPIDLGTGLISVSASIGLSTAHSPTDTAASLIHQADIAMYEAKTSGRNRFAIFDAALRAELDRRLELERDLRSALEREELELRYQPIVAIGNGAVVGFEAHLHWDHAERGVVPLTELLPLAEQSGLIVPLGLWVTRTATEQVAAWRADGTDLFLALNVSPRQLADEGFVAGLKATLEAAKLPHRALAIELAEAAVLADPAKAATRLAELHELGVGLALDDFGAGYAPLRHLIELPFDAIKLNPSFIGELAATGTRASRAAVVAVVAAARELEISVFAEGIESMSQLEELRAVGCSAAQGPLFAPARPASEVTFERFATSDI
jgi:diguanylate cyclase (GGDEF)-like protein/PAS domain S-box-containing protein